jgi:hypothetical protein
MAIYCHIFLTSSAGRMRQSSWIYPGKSSALETMQILLAYDGGLSVSAHINQRVAFITLP